MSSESLTVQEAAELAKVHEETVRRWIRAGVIHATVTPGGREYRIARAELERTGAVAAQVAHGR